MSESSLLDAIAKMDARTPPKTVASPDHASVLDAALDVDALDNMRDEDVTVDMLRACVKRLRSAEEKLAQVSNKRKGLALGEVTNTKFHKAGDEKQTTTVTTKRKQMIVKKILTAAKQSLRGVKFFSGYDATPREAKAQDLITRAEFDSVFTGGTILQPTPQNKPNSQVIVRQFNQSQASELFGSATGILKGELWQKGGAPACGFGVFGGGGGFSKGKKLRSVELTILSMKVSYSNSSQLLSVNISVVNVDSDQGGFDSDY